MISQYCKMKSINHTDIMKPEYQEKVIPAAVRNRVSMEAGVTMPWYRFVGLDGKALGIDHYGASAPAAILFKEFGFTVENVVKAAREVAGK